MNKSFKYVVYCCCFFIVILALSFWVGRLWVVDYHGNTLFIIQKPFLFFFCYLGFIAIILLTCSKQDV